MAFEILHRNKFIKVEPSESATENTLTIDDLIRALNGMADELRTMKTAGCILDNDKTSADDDYYYITTDDPEVAERFGMEESDDEDVEVDDE